MLSLSLVNLFQLWFLATPTLQSHDGKPHHSSGRDLNIVIGLLGKFAQIYIYRERIHEDFSGSRFFIWFIPQMFQARRTNMPPQTVMALYSPVATGSRFTVV